MPYRIESIEVYVRETPPGRMSFVIGKQKKPANAKVKPSAGKRRPRGILMCRMEISDEQGRQAWGASGDRPSFGWLDKRPKYDSEQKLQRLFDLVQTARKYNLDHPRFESPFEQWLACHSKVQRVARGTDHESLSASYASSLIERAMIDAVCRLHNQSFFNMLRGDRLGLNPGRLFPELKSTRLSKLLPQRPLTKFFIRHTVGLSDPILAADQPREKRINDGEPETLEEYIRHDGLRYFKVKISGEPAADLDRLDRIWSAVLKADQPVITLDGNESADDIDAFARFVDDFERKLPGLFQHTAFIEQPLTRKLTHDPATAKAIHRISQKKLLVIDEADGNTTSFKHAFPIGYSGTSHKNCKGVFKSLMNRCLCHHLNETTDRHAFQTGEDLSLMPVVPLQQDFAALGAMNISHCERNGHHYAFGNSHLTKEEQELALKHHSDIYTQRRGEIFLNIRAGQLDCGSLQSPSFATRYEPDWNSMTPISKWEPVW